MRAGWTAWALVVVVSPLLLVSGAAAGETQLPQQKGLAFLPSDANLALYGANRDDHAGGSVAAIGDVNGDGLADMLVGAAGASNNGRVSSGSAYVVFGQRVPGSLALGGLGGAGFRIDGAKAYDSLGASVASAGDVNGDGRSDVLIGGGGSAYVVFGKASTANIDLASLGDGGFRISNSGAYESTGKSVAGAGDVNGDGRADLLIGAPYASNNGRYSSGSAYLVYGKTSTTNVDLASLGEGGFRIDGGNDYDYAGTAVALAGDVNGDGRPDVILGAYGTSSNGRRSSGSAYVVFGRPGLANVDLASLGEGGFRIDGANAYDYAGTSVAVAGDVNSDGLQDLLVGTWNAGADVVFGQGKAANVDLDALDANGFHLSSAVDDHAGSSVAGIGDVNGDGRADVLVGAPDARYQDQPDAGAADVIYGFGTPELAYDPLVAVAGKPVPPAPPRLVKRTGPARFTVAPRLPAGLTVDQGSGVISGTPVTPGPRTSYTVTMNDLAGTTRAELAVTVKDETAPTLVLRGRNPQRVLRQAGVLVRASCNEACSLRASGTVTVADLKTVVGLGTARSGLRGPGAVTLTLALSRPAQMRLARLLAQRRRGRAAVTVRAIDRAGNASSLTRVFALTG